MIPKKKQIENGIFSEDVICKTHLTLIFKASNGSPVCVLPTTVEKLIQRGWTNYQ